LTRLPVIDKSAITENSALLFNPLPGRKYQAKQTGGSTGDPLRYYIDLEAVSQHWAFILWCWHQYAGYLPGDPYLTVSGSSLGTLGARFRTKVYHTLQNNYLIKGDLISPDMRVDSNKIRQARFLYGYPSSIVSLIETRPDIFRGHRLKAVFTTSEQLLPKVRQFIETQLGISTYDMYGANDGGVISCECREHVGFHYDPLNCYIEEYRNEESLVELLLTSLNSYSFPFVRYRVGDVAVLDEFGSCSCGSPFPLILNLSGRTRDLVKLADGRKVHGVKLNKFIFSYPEIRRYRVIQLKDLSITVQVEIDKFDTWAVSDTKDRFENQIKNLLPGSDIVIEKLTTAHAGDNKFKVIESHAH
jgi:phenylacetate-CoA ligase